MPLTGVEIYILLGLQFARATPTSKVQPQCMRVRHQFGKWPVVSQRRFTVSFGGRSFDLKGPCLGLREPCVGREAFFGFRGPFVGLKGSSFDLRGPFCGQTRSYVDLKGLCVDWRRAIPSRPRAPSDRQMPSFCLKEASLGLRRLMLAWEEFVSLRGPFRADKGPYLADRDPLSAYFFC